MNAKSDLPGDRPDSNSLPKGEFFTLAGVAAALGLGGGATKALYEKLKSDEPLLIQILDSSVSGKSHQLSLRIMNLTLHAIYIDEIEVEKPKKTTLTITALPDSAGKSTATFDEATAMPSVPTLPFRLAPEGAISIGALIPLGADDSKPHGTLEIKYSKLDEKEQKTLKQDVLLRWS